MSLTKQLADIISGTSFKDIPKEAVEIGRHVLLDAIGTTIAGVNEPLGLGRKTLEYTKMMSAGSAGDASVIGGGFKTSMLNAAYANGVLCHALDYDNTWWPRNHPASPTIPAILATAERSKLPGSEVLLAIVLAFEVQGRIRVASSRMNTGGTFHHPSVSGTMGSTTGVGKLLNLTSDQFRMAYGIAGSRCSSLTANHGTMTKPSHSGHGARMGLEAAHLASIDFTGAEDIFGEGNFFPTFYDGADNCDPELLVESFGDPYRMVEPGVSFKRYPAKYSTHRTIEGATDLSKEHDLKLADIEAVEVDYPPTKLVDRPKPRTGLEGKFSLQYAACIGLLDRQCTIQSFTNERRFAEDMEALLQKVTLVEKKDIPGEFPISWVVVRVRTTDGRVLERKCAKLRGMQGVPLPREERLEKFFGCVTPALSQSQADDVVGLVDNMADLKDIQALMNILVTPAALAEAAE